MVDYQLAPRNDPLAAVKLVDGNYDEEALGRLDYDPELSKYGGKYDRKFAVGQVTIRLPEYSLINWIAILYGFLPFIVPGLLFIDGFIYKHFMGKFGVILSLICVVVNEIMLKPILNEPRPKESANKHKDGSMKPGMPSGHVLNAGVLFTWSLLELIFAVDAANMKTRLAWFIIISVVMVPVPWSRWHNRDHTAAQCCVSLMLGLIAGSIGVYVRKKYYPHHWQHWEQPIF